MKINKKQIFNSIIKAFIISVPLIVAGCYPRVPLNTSYFNSNSKIGLLITPQIRYTYSASSYGAGMVGGIIDAATTPKGKYDSALKIIGPQLNPRERLKQIYIDQLEPKGKIVIPMANGLKKEDIHKFEPPNTEKKYSKIDFRYLRDSYQMDELMLVSISYGMHSHFSYGIETWKAGRASIIVEIIDLRDNSIIYKDYKINTTRFAGKWDTPPEYLSMRNAINKSIDEVISSVRTIKLAKAKKS